MKLDSAGVANDLKEKAENHCAHVAPCFVLDSQNELSDEEQSEDSCVENVAPKGWDVEERRQG